MIHGKKRLATGKLDMIAKFQYYLDNIVSARSNSISYEAYDWGT